MLSSITISEHFGLEVELGEVLQMNFTNDDISKKLVISSRHLEVSHPLDVVRRLGSFSISKHIIDLLWVIKKKEKLSG